MNKLSENDIGKQFKTVSGDVVTMIKSPECIPKKKGFFLFDDNMWRDAYGDAGAPNRLNLVDVIDDEPPTITQKDGLAA